MQPGFEQLEAAARQRCQGACEVTGVPEAPALPLRVLPCWRYDYPGQRVRLVGSIAVCEPIARVKQLDQLEGEEERRAALTLLQQVHAWSLADLNAYLRFVEGRQFVVSGPASQSWAAGGWRVDWGGLLAGGAPSA